MKLSKRARRGAAAVLTGAALLYALPAFAQAPRTYAVMSLMGDKIGVVTSQPSTGTSLDRNLHLDLDVPDDVFDATAARTASDMIARANPGAVTRLYSSRDPKLFALQDKLVDSETLTPALAESLRDLLVQSKATHLLLITKYRADARLRMADGHVGTGKLKGIGFYVDPSMTTTNSESGKLSHGFFATYAYLKLTLIDAATLQAIGLWVTTESHVYGTSVSQTASVPWEALSSADKVAALHAVITDAVEDAMPRVIAVR